MRISFILERALACELAARGDASARSSDDSAMRTLLHSGDVSRGFSTESARATLLQGGDASRGSSTESARASFQNRGSVDFSEGLREKKLLLSNFLWRRSCRKVALLRGHPRQDYTYTCAEATSSG